METAYIFLAVMIFLMYSLTLWYSSIENFEDGGSVVYEDAKDIYDPEYASIYDLLWRPNEQLKYEQVSVHDIALVDKAISDVHILDMCCGTAPNACYFKTLGVDYLGVDTSDAMLKKARENCPSAKFQNGDITQVHAFPQKSMTTCLLTGFSIYEFRNPKIVSDNAYQWLAPDGYFVVHMVDPDKFDPMLDLAAPFAAFSLQKYSIDRQNKSTVYFDKFKYIGAFEKEKDNDSAVFNETFVYYDKEDNSGNKHRENKRYLNMPSKERLIDIIKTSGFRHVETVDLVRCGKEYQYLVYFTK